MCSKQDATNEILSRLERSVSEMTDVVVSGLSDMNEQSTHKQAVSQ